MVGSLVPLGVQPQCQQICAEVISKNPGKVRNVHGYNTEPDHNNRRCVDYMIYDKAGGDQIVEYYLDDKDRLLVNLIIWYERIMRSYDKPGIPAWTWAKYTGPKNHKDHPHVEHKAGTYKPPTGGVPVDNPKNEEGIKKGDKVKVNATGGLKGRATPGGSVNLVRPDGYEFVVKEVRDGWASGGQNWYSTDYLDIVKPPVTPPKPPVTPPAAKPSWIKTPVVKLSMAKIPNPVNYLQAVVKVAGGVVDGKKVADIYVLAQDPDGKGNTRFLAYSLNGTYINSMTVKNGGHGQTFHAYRSAAGNLYIWTLIGDYAYRIKWQPGKTVTTGTKMAYGTARPVGVYESFVGFRAANSTHETFTLHDRFGFTDPSNNSSKPIKKVTVKKRTDYTQQSWSMSSTRIYRIMGKTNTDAGKGSRKHILDVFDWSGKLLLDRFDLTAMSLPGATSDEPEGLTFTGTPGSVLAGKRSGPNNKTRTYPIWQLTGLP